MYRVDSQQNEPRPRAAFSLCLTALCLALLPAALAAGEATPSCHAAPAAVTAESGEVATAESGGAGSEGLKIPDLEVVDQDGRELRFYEDLVRDRVVAINFVFTTCTTVCPPMGATFSRLQKLLAEQRRDDVALISVSIDPAVDTPARLKAWGENFGAGERWTLVTGAKPQIDRLLKGLGVFTAEKAEHSPITLLGNDRTGTWKRTNGLASPKKMIEELQALAEAPRPVAESSAVAGR